MKRYLIGLLTITIVMMVAVFGVKWMGMAPFESLPLWMLPVTVLYFAVVYGVQYWLTVRSVGKTPKAFVQFFLATTVAVLFIHLVFLVGGMLLNPVGGKSYAIAFLVLYVVYSVYLTAMLVRFVRHGG